MNSARFVDSAQRISARLSRRTSLGLLAGVGLPIFGLAGDAEAKKKRRKKKVTLCSQGQTIKVSTKKSKKLIPQGATKGACDPLCGQGGTCTVFVTANTFTGGAIGGLSGGDATCQSAASAAGLPGTYKAWLSAGSATPGVRFARTEAVGPFRLVRNASDGADPGPLVANTFAELISCEGSDDCLQHGIDRTESGATPDVAVTWTGTTSDGSASGQTCSEWTSSSNAVKGVVGASGSSAFTWTIIAETPCDNARPLYCFEQSA